LGNRSDVYKIDAIITVKTLPSVTPSERSAYH
jgi:hypothetical protein